MNWLKQNIRRLSITGSGDGKSKFNLTPLPVQRIGNPHKIYLFSCIENNPPKTNLDEGLDDSPKPKSFFQLLRRGEAGILNGFFFALAGGLITSGLVMVAWCLLSIETHQEPTFSYDKGHSIRAEDDLVVVSALTGGLFFVHFLGTPILKRLKAKHQTPQDSQGHSAAAKEESQ